MEIEMTCPVKSHQCDFAVLAVLKLIGSILVPLAAFAAVMRVGAASKLLPSPRPALDMDRAILIHQAEASRSKHEADLLLIGDSSCLMDVSAPQLSAALAGGHHALNLGTLSYLDLSSYASILREYLRVNPGRVSTVVLLMHPEALRRAGPEEYHVEMLDRYYAAEDFCEPSASRMSCWMGGAIFKGRVLSRWVPIPLEGVYGQKYGFTSGLWNYLSTHDGSAVDPRKYDRSTVQGNAEYHLSPRLERTSQTFRSAVPNGARLAVGITPAPENFVKSDFSQRHAEMLNQWSAWVRADAVLADLPQTMPADLFASTTHLNEAGQSVFTAKLASLIAALPPKQ